MILCVVQSNVLGHVRMRNYHDQIINYPFNSIGLLAPDQLR